MSEIASLLRLQVQSDKEAVVTCVTVTDAPTVFTSQLTGNNTRKSIQAYNNSNSGSGEVYYGYAGSGEMDSDLASYPIPKGESAKINVAVGIDVYFVSDAGETGDLRVEELA